MTKQNKQLSRLGLFTLLFLFIFPALVHAQLGDLYQGREAFRNGEYAEAVEYLQTALAADSMNVQVYVLLSSSYLALSNSENAIEIARKGLERSPDNRTLQLLLGEGLIQEQNFADAIGIYEDLLRQERFETDTPSQETITPEYLNQRLGAIHQNQGLRLFQEGDSLAGLQHFQQSRQYLPDSLAVYQNLASAYLQLGRYQQAVSTADSGLIRFPQSTPLLQLKASALFQLEQYEQLENIYSRLHQLHPENIDVSLVYGEALLANQQVNEAYDLFETLLQEHPENRKVYEALIRINERSMNYQGKIGMLRQMRQQFPEDTTVVRNMVDTYRAMEEYSNARAMLDTLQLMSGETLSAQMEVATTYEQQDSTERAAEIYTELLDQYPGNVQLLRRYGEILMEQTQWEKAQDIYAKLISLETSGYAFRNLGFIEEKLSNDNRAESLYRRSIDQDNQHPLPVFRMGVLQQSEGQVDSAFTYVEKALELSLQGLTRQQQELQSRMQESGNTINSINASTDLRENLLEFNRLAEEIFTYLMEQFAYERTQPLVEELVNRYTDSARLRYLTGLYYRHHGQPNLAEKHLLQAVNLSASLEEAHLSLAHFYTEQGETDEAIQAYRRVLSLDPENAEAHDRLIDLSRERGSLDTLCDNWLARYRGNPDNDVLREYLIEALHKAERYEEARTLVASD